MQSLVSGECENYLKCNQNAILGAGLNFDYSQGQDALVGLCLVLDGFMGAFLLTSQEIGLLAPVTSSKVNLSQEVDHFRKG